MGTRCCPLGQLTCRPHRPWGCLSPKGLNQWRMGGLKWLGSLGDLPPAPQGVHIDSCWLNLQNFPLMYSLESYPVSFLLPNPQAELTTSKWVSRSTRRKPHVAEVRSRHGTSMLSGELDWQAPPCKARQSSGARNRPRNTLGVTPFTAVNRRQGKKMEFSLQDSSSVNCNCRT